jgi:Flp pilus assembly secretin CpaC
MKFATSSRHLIAIAFSAFALAGLTAQAVANDKSILVDIDYARVVKIPDGAGTLVIGNPLVADVTMLKSNQLMVITGKSFGTTNLIVLDRTGAQVGESLITVVPTHDKLVMQRGPHRESYSCKPDCMPSIDLGDDKEYLGQTLETMRLHDSAAATKR